MIQQYSAPFLLDAAHLWRVKQARKDLNHPRTTETVGTEIGAVRLIEGIAGDLGRIS